MSQPYDLVTVNDVKKYASSVQGNNLDDLIGELISTESKFIDEFLERNVISTGTDITEHYDGENTAMLPLASWPITSVSLVEVFGTPWPLADDARGVGYNFNQRFLLAMGQRFPAGFRGVKVTYRAGYTQSNVPISLKQACCELVAYRLEERKRQGQESKTLAGEQVTFSKGPIPDSIKARLNDFRSYVIGRLCS